MPSRWYGRPARDQVVEGRGHRVQVRPVVAGVGPAGERLGRAVGQGVGHLGGGRLPDGGDAEVGELGDPPGQHDVGRLHVSVEDALLVGVAQGGRDRQHQLHRLVPGQPAPGVDEVLQRTPGHQLHHQVGGAGAGVAGPERHDHVGVRRELAHDAPLPIEAAAARVVQGVEQLHRHAAVEPAVVGRVDGAEPTPPDDLKVAQLVDAEVDLCHHLRARYLPSALVGVGPTLPARTAGRDAS